MCIIHILKRLFHVVWLWDLKKMYTCIKKSEKISGIVCKIKRVKNTTQQTTFERSSSSARRFHVTDIKNVDTYSMDLKAGLVQVHKKTLVLFHRVLLWRMDFSKKSFWLTNPLFKFSLHFLRTNPSLLA